MDMALLRGFAVKVTEPRFPIIGVLPVNCLKACSTEAVGDMAVLLTDNAFATVTADI